MTLIFKVTALLCSVSMIIAYALQGGFNKTKRSAPGFYRRLLLRQALLLPLYVCLLVPLLLGFVGSRMVGTRSDERAYVGPILDAAGDWQVQTRATIRPRDSLSDAELAGIAKRTLRITTSARTGEADHTLRAFFVPCRSGKPKATVLLVHGLFRSAMELERVAAMFRDLEADVMLLELSCHGGSDRRPFTFGLHERDDVLAAVDHLHQREGGLHRPLILYGMSMGSIAVMRAAPRIAALDGLCLEAPVFDFAETAHLTLGRTKPKSGRGSAGIPGFLVSLSLSAVELWSGFEIEELRCVEAIESLSPELPSLLIGAGLDNKVPPESVRRGFARLAAPVGRKVLWIDHGSKHGRVFENRPDEYRRHLGALIERAAVAAERR